MSTGTSLVQQALQKIGVHSAIKSANAEAMENGRKVLNSLFEELTDKDIIIGARPLEAIGQEFGEPSGATNPIIYLLAERLQIDYIGTEPSMNLTKMANRAMNYLELYYEAISIPNPTVRNTLPKGQGNYRDRDYQTSTYFKAGDELGED